MRFFIALENKTAELSSCLKLLTVLQTNKLHCDAKKFGLFFACAVIVESADASDLVARKGDTSLFQVLKDLIPEVRT